MHGSNNVDLALGAAVDIGDGGVEDLELMSPEDRRLSPFRVFTRQDDEGHLKLPLTVDLFFGLLKLDKYTAKFKENGYDDMRIVATLSLDDVTELILDEEDRGVLLKAGFEWNLKATEFNVIDNWSLECHRAMKSGTFDSRLSASAGQDEESANRALAEKAIATGEAVLSADGLYYIGTDGKMDLKHGDEVVETGLGSTVDWDPTPILKVLYDSPCPISEGEAIKPVVEVADSAEKKTTVAGFLDKLPQKQSLKSLVKRWNRRYFKVSSLYYRSCIHSTRG